MRGTRCTGAFRVGYNSSVRNVLISVSQFWNAAAGLFPRLRMFGFGDPDETVSSRLGKLARDGNPYARFLCRVIGVFLGPRHCEEAVEEDEGA